MPMLSAMAIESNPTLFANVSCPSGDTLLVHVPIRTLGRYKQAHKSPVFRNRALVSLK